MCHTKGDKVMEKLAMNGGTPVRDTKLMTKWPGALLYGEEEARKVFDVCMAKSPFRYYGANGLNMVKQFEEAFANRMRVKNALGVTSCTASLVVALKAAGIGPGDKVIVPACTFVATAGAVVCAGAVPIFADIDDSLNIDPKQIGKVCDKYTKAVIVVPLLGVPCKMDEIVAEAKKYSLIVIEDVAQSMGAEYHGKPMGSWGDLGVFSMQLNKIITTGEGGVVVTDNDALYERACRYHDQGMYRDNPHPELEAESCLIGQNYRMSELTGAAALVQLERLDSIIARMKEIKRTLKSELSSIDGLMFRNDVDEEGDAAASFTVYFPTVEQTRLFNQAMRAENMDFSTQYGGKLAYMNPQIFNQRTIDPSGFPFNQFDEKIVYTEDMCPYARDLYPRSSFMFLNPCMTDKDVEDVIKAMKKVLPVVL